MNRRVESKTASAAPEFPERRWLRFYDDLPACLDYPEASLCQVLAESAACNPERIAWDFYDSRQNYRELLESVDRAASALQALGLGAGQRLLIVMPTSPQGVIAFYAANRLGATAALIHPLSTPPEIEQAIDRSGARIVLCLDAIYQRVAAARPQRPLEAIVVAAIGDYLSPLKRALFWWRKARHFEAIPADQKIHRWRELMRPRPQEQAAVVAACSTPAALLFSGGSTGEPKGVLLSNRAIIAQGMQTACWGRMRAGDSILAILPLFHGFGLAVCVNATLMAGGTCILVPQFDADEVARLIRKKRPSLLVGVPTLYAALNRNPRLARTDLSFLRAAFSGSDTLPRPVKEGFEALVRANGGDLKLLEGYGLTEAVSAIMAMPLGHYREGSIGLPFPDMQAKICVPGQEIAARLGEEGEICISGPSLMDGYLDDPEASATALRRHADGRVWLHTGDLGREDADGFFYFSLRAKRMIKSSGFNVYPAQVEAVLRLHPGVAEACVIGLPDPDQVERVHACIVLTDPNQASAETAEALIAHCRGLLIKWSCPRAISFHPGLPTTRIGKIDYRALAAERMAQNSNTVPKHPEPGGGEPIR